MEGGKNMKSNLNVCKYKSEDLKWYEYGLAIIVLILIAFGIASVILYSKCEIDPSSKYKYLKIELEGLDRRVSSYEKNMGHLNQSVAELNSDIDCKNKPEAKGWFLWHKTH